MKTMILALLMSQTGEDVPAAVIQARIDAAQPNAVVGLPEGTVNGKLVITRPVTLRGQGETKTTIRGNHDGSVITILVPDEKDQVKLERLEITNGGGRREGGNVTVKLSGAGIQILGKAHVVLEHVLIRRNDALSWGGGIELQHGKLTIRDSEIRENRAHFDGGIAASFGTSVDIEHTVIAENEAESDGGLGFLGRTLRLKDVSFEGNSSKNGCAHLSLSSKRYTSSVLLDNVRFGETIHRAVCIEEGSRMKLSLRKTTWPSDQDLPPGAEILPD